MKKIEKKTIDYMGCVDPLTDDEVELEILGLELAVKIAEQRIALLRLGAKASSVAAKDSEETKSENPLKE